MIHYHGGALTPQTVAVRALSGGHAFISFADPRNLGLSVDVAQSFAVDNGAYSAWRGGTPVIDWTPYYAWVDDVRRYPGFDFAVIPDVIDGDEADNDALVKAWPFPAWVGAPVWHLHESMERLERLVKAWSRVCLGSSGAYARIGTDAWWDRMAEAMDVACDGEGYPRCKLHGLRMLDPKVFMLFPFASADSTNIAANTSLDTRWRGPYAPPTREARADVMRARIEAYQSPPRWDGRDRPVQIGLFAGVPEVTDASAPECLDEARA